MSTSFHKNAYTKDIQIATKHVNLKRIIIYIYIKVDFADEKKKKNIFLIKCDFIKNHSSTIKIQIVLLPLLLHLGINQMDQMAVC